MLNSLWGRTKSREEFSGKFGDDGMKKLTPKQILALVVALTVGQAMAAAPTVGMVVTKDTVRIDSSAVTGNATVLSGNVLESVGGTSELRLRGGSILLATNAKVRAFENRTELQSGKIQVHGAGIATESGEIRVQTPTGSEAILERKSDALVVGSLRGPVQVTNQDGLLLATLTPGSAMAFAPDPDQGGAGASKGTNDTPTATAKNKRKTGKISARTKSAWILGTGAAIATPIAVVATRDNTKPVSR